SLSILSIQPMCLFQVFPLKPLNQLAVTQMYFISTNGGANWTSQFSVPPPVSGVTIPGDWTFAYDRAGTLHGAVLSTPLTPNVYEGMTANPTSTVAWSYTGGGSQINTAASTGDVD